MIKELRLTNWKSFEQSTFYIDPLTILIGTNASGKSNTLDALHFLQRVASGVGIFQAIKGDINLAPIRGGMEWICRKPEKEFSLSITLDGETEQQELRYDLTIQVNGVKAEVKHEELQLLKYSTRSQTPKTIRLFYTFPSEDTGPGIKVNFATKSKGPGKRIQLNSSHLILSQADHLNLGKDVLDAVKRALYQMQNIFVFDPIPSHMRDYAPFSEQLLADGSNIAGVLSAMDEPRKQAVEEILTQYLSALPERDILRIWSEPVGKFQTDAMLYCEESWSETQSHTIDARGMSDGTLRFLAIVMAMLTRKPGSLLVIEEIDNGLHPSRAHVLIKMLHTLGKDRAIDVIVTTHNPALLDAAGARMVPFITVAHRNTRSGVSVLTQLEDLEQLPKLMASGTLGDLSTEGRIEAAQNAPSRLFPTICALEPEQPECFS